MSNVNLIVYPASDISKAKQFFTTLLGNEPYADTPYYVGYKTGDFEIGLDPHSGVPGALAYVDVADINAALAALTAAGAEKIKDVTDVANGLLIAIVKNPDGTPVGLRQMPSA